MHWHTPNAHCRLRVQFVLFLLRNVVKIGQRCGAIKCLIELYSIKVIHAAAYSCLRRNAAVLLSDQRLRRHSRFVNVT